MIINKYGYLRLNYLKENKKVFYEVLLMKGELEKHLFSVSIDCEERFKILMDNFIKNNEKTIWKKQRK